MRTKFGFLATALFTVALLALVPASGQAGNDPNDNGDRLQTRDQLRECSLAVPDQDQLQIRDRLRDRDPAHDATVVLPLTDSGNEVRNRIREQIASMWKFHPGMIPGWIWTGTF